MNTPKKEWWRHRARPDGFVFQMVQDGKESKMEMWTMPELIDLTEKWHVDRNLIDGATSKDQVLKLIQEVGELSDSVCKGTDVKDDIGDCLVILINIAKREGTTLEECLQVAYNDIKDRKGKMVDGIFVKED